MAAPVGPKKVNRYTVEFKIQAVKLASHPEFQVQDVAQALEYFLKNRGLKPSLSWTGTGEFPRESIWQGREEREEWERKHQAQ